MNVRWIVLHVMGLGAVVGMCGTCFLMFGIILLNGRFVGVEPNLLVLGFEILYFGVFGMGYVAYLVVKWVWLTAGMIVDDSAKEHKLEGAQK